MKLLYKPIPCKNESLGSLLLRATEHNGWQSVSSFLAAVNSAPHRGQSTVTAILSNQERWDSMCETIGLNAEEASHLCYKRDGVSGRSKVIFHKISIAWGKLRLIEPAICPICLSVQGYADSHWDFSLVSACPTHRVKLINRCQKCGDKLHWNRRSISSCKCGFNLCESQTERANPRATKFIYSLLAKKDEGKIDELFDIYKAIESFFEFIEIPLDVHDLIRLTVFSTIKPINLETKLIKIVKYINKTNGMHPRIILHAFLVSENFDLVRMANRVINCLLINLHSGHEPLTGHIPARSAYTILEISYDQLIELLDQNILTGYKRNSNVEPSRLISLFSINNLVNSLSCKKSFRLHRHDFEYYGEEQLTEMTKINRQISVEDLLKQLDTINSDAENEQTRKLSYKGYLTIPEAAMICDVYYENIRFAVHCKILKRLPPEKTKGTKIFISESSVSDFNKNFIFTKGIAKKYKVNPRNIAEKIISTGINPVSGPRIDGGLTYLFNRNDLDPLDIREIARLKNYPTKTGRKKIENLPLREHFITLPSAAKALGVSSQRVAQLIRKGLLIRFIDNKRSISVTYESFIKIYELTDSSNYLTIEFAAELLSETKREFYKRYLNTKIINKIYEGVELYISSNDFYKIEQFKKEFITSKEAGDKFGASRSLLHNLHKMKEAKPVKTYFVGKNCIHFYDREKLKEYFFKKRYLS